MAPSFGHTGDHTQKYNVELIQANGFAHPGAQKETVACYICIILTTIHVMECVYAYHPGVLYPRHDRRSPAALHFNIPTFDISE
ncbi:hypothetical protein SeLEV6574_g02190 [Synchytrium endobioticum]|nr:hypothetical protein SeLEV6574_g02190 [Synchytrium endobioticum]